MMMTKAENRAQLEAVAEKMKARRRSKDSSSQRAKLKVVADKMKTTSRKSRSRTSSEDMEGVTKPRRSRTRKTPSRSKSGGSSSTTLGSSLEASLGKLSMDDRRSPVADMDESSVSTYSTAPESSLNNSYTGSLDSRSVLSHHSSNNSSLNRMLSAANSSSQELLDCSLFLILTNLWETVKRMDGYEADLGEHIICRMMTAADAADTNVRQELGLTSFRSERFAQLARHLMDTIDVLVTMLGPDIDDDELREIGANMRDQGIQPKLFGQAVALAMRDLMGEAELATDDFDAWNKAFRFVCRKMDM